MDEKTIDQSIQKANTRYLRARNRARFIHFVRVAVIARDVDALRQLHRIAWLKNSQTLVRISAQAHNDLMFCR